jgi:polysaccharide biosynthesis transport protein
MYHNTEKRLKILPVLWSGRRWSIYGMLFSIGIAVLFLSLITPSYLAVSQLLINPADSRAVEMSESPLPEHYDTNALQIESQTHVLTSQMLLRRVVDKLHLDQDHDFIRSRLDAVMELIAQKTGFHMSQDEIEPANKALRTLEKLVTSKRRRGTYVVDVEVVTGSPVKSVTIAGAIVQAYVEDQAAVRSEAAHRVTQALSSRLQELRVRVRDAEERVQEYRLKNDLVEANGMLVAEQQFVELNNQLARARARTAEAQAIQSRIPNFGLGDQPRKVLARGDLDRALAMEQSLENKLEALKSESVRKSQVVIRLRELQRDVDASRAVFQSFLLRENEMRERERMDTSNVRVISNATLPAERIWPPRRTFVISMSLVLGALAGCSITWASHITKKSEPLHSALRHLELGSSKTHIAATLKVRDSAPLLAATPPLPSEPQTMIPQATSKVSEMPLSGAPSIYPGIAVREPNRNSSFNANELPSMALDRIARKSRTRSSRATKLSQIETAIEKAPASDRSAVGEGTG